jgi:hypothetical protein
LRSPTLLSIFDETYTEPSMDIPIPELNRSILLAFLRILARVFTRSAALAAALAIAATTGMPSRACAATVSGILVQYEGAPDPNRDLHFENVITHDIYMAPTHQDGSFSQQLPPGTYRLRTEVGAILASDIGVANADVPLGRVSELAPLAPARLFQFQKIAPTILKSPAPSTAFTYTEDTTVLPPTAQAVPKQPSAIIGSASRAERGAGSANAARTATGNEPASAGLFPLAPPPSAPNNPYYEPPLIPSQSTPPIK